MKTLTLTEKMLIQKMMIETLEIAFDKNTANEIYLAYSEAVFRKVESSEWFQEGKDILTEYVSQILSAIMIDAAKFMFEGEQD